MMFLQMRRIYDRFYWGLLGRIMLWMPVHDDFFRSVLSDKLFYVFLTPFKFIPSSEGI